MNQVEIKKMQRNIENIIMIVIKHLEINRLEIRIYNFIQTFVSNVPSTSKNIEKSIWLFIPSAIRYHGTHRAIHINRNVKIRSVKSWYAIKQINQTKLVYSCVYILVTDKLRLTDSDFGPCVV